MEKIQVMKFGGASVKDAGAVRNVADIIRQHIGRHGLLVVISAMDKTTNHLEQLAWLARDSDEPATWQQFRNIRDFHHEIVQDLFGEADNSVRARIGDYFMQIERIIRGILLLGEFPNRTYDRIVAFGELLSTAIVTEYLRQSGIRAACPDVRDIIKTDASYTQAQVVWSLTRDNIQQVIRPQLAEQDVLITQGFIASSIEGKVTTLGREGSDYTASIFASALEAESLTVWKDVRGILNGDPRLEAETTKLDAISYERAVEMTFYGATVIHPKTIKPLRNAGIPLYVKCFKDLSEAGTTIGREAGQQQDVCIRVVKKNQALLRLQPRDFSFMESPQINKVFSHVARAGVEVNLIQSTAISMLLCVSHHDRALSDLKSLLLDDFDWHLETGLHLRSFIHYGPAEEAAVAEALLVQRTADKLLAVLRD